MTTKTMMILIIMITTIITIIIIIIMIMTSYDRWVPRESFLPPRGQLTLVTLSLRRAVPLVIIIVCNYRHRHHRHHLVL